MTKRRLDFKSEDGVVAVFVALIMVTLLSFTALVTDYGIFYYKKSELQTAVDAAALAAVYALPDEIGATAIAQRIMQENGFSTDGVEVTLHNNGTQVRVTSPRQMDTYFANLFGITHMDYVCAAMAQTDIRPAGGAFDYLLFSGDPRSTLVLKTNFNIYGSVHSNGDLTSTYNNGYIMGAAEAVGNVLFPDKIVTGQTVSNAPFVPMVDFTTVLDQVVPKEFTHSYSKAQIQDMSLAGTVVVPANQRWFIVGVSPNDPVTLRNGLRVEGKLVVRGSLIVNGNVSPRPAWAESNSSITMTQHGVISTSGSITVEKHFSGEGCLFAGGSIWFANGYVYCLDRRPVSLYSANGNITLNFGKTYGYGIIYAPNGNITAGGGNTTWYGSIIGNTISAIPANITMYANDAGTLPFIIGSRSAILVE